ncbi:beta-galactosidase [Ruficoccus amylovorans]|uniref:Beta-galactosidase n=1 Tax=Ruficoccus amylovorans TaxID=1804625 RepID=A0A842HDB2_9BACT|nr:beta-galactosidase [Ruficoccus amylovorans]MBC2593676.1 beta-galactosidase [Ruficoccus amylovorans]
MQKTLPLLCLLTMAALRCGAASDETNRTLPLPPRANPPGQAQPVFGAGEGSFTFDGEPAVIISGSVHYARVPREYWRDRIRKAKAMGFNCIGTYIFWNAHEKKPGEFDFSGNLDIAEFVRVCQEEGMWVIVRPGPYVCAEWTLGGIPPWLLAEPDLDIRTNDPRFLEATGRYFKAVGEQLKDLQVTHGGPIIQVQVENEYGQFGRPGNADDIAYNQAIYDLLREGGFDTMFIRCDWPVEETISTADIDGVYTTMNFGGSADKAFGFFEEKYPGMPMMCGEYWVGWFDHWGAKHHTKALAPFIKEIDWMLDNGVSFNVYMLHGGTNFGFNSGANWSSGQYSADTTSYDYDAPIDELGGITEKFYTFRDTISKYLPEGYEIPDAPEPLPRMAIPAFDLREQAAFQQLMPPPLHVEELPTLESIGQTQGLTLFRTTIDIPRAGKYKLAFSALKDRAIVIVNDQRVATLDRRMRQDSTMLELPAGKAELEVLLENMGYLNYSREMMQDRKGLGEVTLDGEKVTGWDIYPVPLELADVASLEFGPVPVGDSVLPVFFRGTFEVDQPADTLLDMSGWGKGMVWVNGVNLGRFWDIGPQKTLYLPGPWMRKGENEIIVMDIEPTGKTTISGVTEPIYALKVDKSLAYSRKPGETLRLSPKQLVAEGAFANGDVAETVDFGREVQARYVCIEALNSYSNDNHAAIAEIHLIDGEGKWLDRDGWKVIYADSEEIIAEPSPASNIIDNQPVTYWHTRYAGDEGETPFPHQIVIDLGEVQTIRALRYLPRNGANPGKVKDYRIYTDQALFKGLKGKG